jgi:hypothetical protein
MDNLSTDELIQIIAYYKQKISDAELDLLKMQLKVNQLNSQLLEASEKNNKKTK